MIAAVRVPPSAWMTSQSTFSVYSPPIARMSITVRSERPMRRWISCVRPPGAPRVTSRFVRVFVDAGSSEYSAVTQPAPLPRRQAATVSENVAAHSTFVSPSSNMHEPCACLR